MNHQELIQALEQAQDRLLVLAQEQSQVLGLAVSLLQQEHSRILGLAVPLLQQGRPERFQQVVKHVMVENQELLQRLALVEAE